MPAEFLNRSASGRALYLGVLVQISDQNALVDTLGHGDSSLKNCRIIFTIGERN